MMGDYRQEAGSRGVALLNVLEGVPEAIKLQQQQQLVEKKGVRRIKRNKELNEANYEIYKESDRQ